MIYPRSHNSTCNCYRLQVAQSILWHLGLIPLHHRHNQARTYGGRFLREAPPSPTTDGCGAHYWVVLSAPGEEGLARISSTGAGPGSRTACLRHRRERTVFWGGGCRVPQDVVHLSGTDDPAL